MELLQKVDPLSTGKTRPLHGIPARSAILEIEHDEYSEYSSSSHSYKLGFLDPSKAQADEEIPIYGQNKGSIPGGIYIYTGSSVKSYTGLNIVHAKSTIALCPS